LLFDSAGNIYGTTPTGGSGQGVVYQLTNSGGNWSETPIHIFNGSDGKAPSAGVSADTAGTTGELVNNSSTKLGRFSGF
jgi:hypothetical protein